MMSRFIPFLIILFGIGFIISSIAFKYIFSKKYFNKYSDPHKYISLTFYVIFISGISYIIIGVLYLYINSSIFKIIISLIPAVILILSSIINEKFGIKE